MQKSYNIFLCKYNEPALKNKVKKKVMGWQRIKLQFYNQYCSKNNKKEEKINHLARNTFPIRNYQNKQESILISTPQNNTMNDLNDKNKESKQIYRRTVDKARKQLKKKSQKQFRVSLFLGESNFKHHKCMCVFSPKPCSFCSQNLHKAELKSNVHQTKKFHNNNFRLRSHYKSDISKRIDSLLKQCTNLWRENSTQSFTKNVQACSTQFKRNLQESTLKLERALSCVTNKR